MSGYELSPQAILDLHEILTYREEHSGIDAAEELQEQILIAIERLVVMPGMGHRRSDLTELPYFFHGVNPYLIVYARETDPLRVLAIVHSSRNVRRLLKQRFR
ncbi:antitoxin ParD1/3/4 [Granulicella rosea]|uniref:Antitoxin ParD1/3/4 n=1 Tax=Granulicella rosea TaxID=474952 RepID=A0A239JPB0_9BACT|nr:antitoxin ParD1/3/4 [Granulicella rosea]